MPLLDEKEPEPDIHEETGSLLSTEDIEILESFDEGTAAYFGKMLDWLENFIKSGVEKGRFSEKQAHQDLQIALWYAFACLNLDDYIHYYRAAEWMKDSEKNATGCATWYYRYSVALMYCGRLEEALEYAERGALEEPDYPWIWLHLGKLRAHFGDKSGALDAVKQGLKLEPGDYEFLTLKKEIKAGATLEQMEYHWINPDADQTLQRGLDENADDKQCAIACIRVDEAGLAEFYELFHPERYSYKKNSPCCEFQYPVKEHLVELSFRMNEAGLSKMGTDWLRQLKERLDSGEWLTHTPEGEPEGILTGVFVDQTRRIGLVYQQPGDDQYFQIFLNPDGTKADAFWSSRKNSEPEVYSEDEMSAIEQHIKNTFGEFENVFHELVSPDIHVDICVVPPSDERDYYTLVTMGMGAHRMNVPEELAEYKLERAELAIALPPDWKLDEESLKDERWYWPIGLLKVLARLPISNDMGVGSTVEISLGEEQPSVSVTISGLYAPAKVYSGHGRMHLDGATLFAPEALFHELHPEITSFDYSWSIVNDAKKTDYVGAELKNIVASHSNIALDEINTVIEYEEMTNSFAFGSMEILSWLVFLFGVINLINTTLSNQIARKQENSILRSIGLTQKQLCEMNICEGLCYALFATLATLIVGLPASIFACRKMSIGAFAGNVVPYKFPVLEMGLFILVLFGMELILSVWTIRRQKKQSLIEQMRAME